MPLDGLSDGCDRVEVRRTLKRAGVASRREIMNEAKSFICHLLDGGIGEGMM